MWLPTMKLSEIKSRSIWAYAQFTGIATVTDHTGEKYTGPVFVTGDGETYVMEFQNDPLKGTVAARFTQVDAATSVPIPDDRQLTLSENTADQPIPEA